MGLFDGFEVVGGGDGERDEVRVECGSEDVCFSICWCGCYNEGVRNVNVPER